MSKTLAAYIRKSYYDDASQTDRDAVERRWRAIEAWANEHGPFALKRYEDLDLSGRYEAGRPGWAALVAGLDDPDMWGVIVEDWRDSHRNVKEFLTFFDAQLAPRGLRIVCLAYPTLDPSTVDGRMLLINLLNINEWESAKSGERRRKAIRHKTEALGRHWGPTPFGCDRDPATKHLIPSAAVYWLDPDGSAWRPDDLPLPAGCEERYYFDSLHALYNLYAPGSNSLADVAVALNAAGWRNWQRDYQTPQPWNRYSVKSVLQHWYLYAGQRAPLHTNYRHGQPREMTDAGHEALLPVELCQAVALALGQRHFARARYKPPAGETARRIFPLSGVLYCHACGQRLHGQQAGKYIYYRHILLKGCAQKSAHALPLEAEILNGLALLSAHPDILDDVAARLRSAYLLSAGEGSAFARLDQARREYDRLIDLYTAGLITQAEFMARRNSYAAEIARLENETASHPARMLAEINPAELLARLDVSRAGPLAQKSMVHSVFERIEIYDGQIAAVTPRPWAAPLFEICRLWSKSEFNPQSAQIPAWLLV